MSRRLQTGSTSTGLAVMYYGVCLFLLAFIGSFLSGLVARSVGIDLLTYLKIIRYLTIGAMALYFVGSLLCLTISKEVDGSAFLYSSIGLWLIPLGILVYEIVSGRPQPPWVQFLSLVINILSFVLFLFFLRLLASALESKDLQSRATNTMQICFFMIALFAALVGLINFAPEIFIQIVRSLDIGYPLALVAAIGITVIVYGKLLLYTAREIDTHHNKIVPMDA
jgi:hypothetical protein